MGAKVKARFDGMDKKFAAADARFDGIDKRLDGVDKRLDGIDKRLDGLEMQVRNIARTVAGHTEQLSRIWRQLAKLDVLERMSKTLDLLVGEYVSSKRGRELMDRSFSDQQATLADHELRLTRLERRATS